jgi:hypothetical protein
MATAQRVTATTAIVMGLILLSWLTVFPGVPEVYAPLNFLVMVPYFLGGRLVAFSVIPVFFLLWCLPMLRNGAQLPTRSIILLVCAVALSAISLISGYNHGIEYQGFDYTRGVFIINLVWWALLGGLAVFARCRPGIGQNLVFHAMLFAWLAWYAFPYLGELP